LQSADFPDFAAVDGIRFLRGWRFKRRYAVRRMRPSRRSAGIDGLAELDGLQENLIGRAAAAPVSQKIEAAVVRFDQNQPHAVAAFDARHLGRGLKARAGGRRSGNVKHRVLDCFAEETQRYAMGAELLTICPIQYIFEKRYGTWNSLKKCAVPAREPGSLERDPDPKGRVSAKWEPVFPRDKRESVCAEITLKQRDEIMMRFNLIAS
jgi:hypothetical protein